MGKLLDFADAPLRRETAARPVPASGAEVVIFPGIRVEPHTDETNTDAINSVDLGARVQTVSRGRNKTPRPDA